jgi:hypothetical protein
MHCCEFCSTHFLSRPQVKTPRACSNCQTLRQRANEREWHEKHTHFDDAYHGIRRKQREQKILKLISILIECLRIGQSLSGLKFDTEKFSKILEARFLELGVRQINKFCDLQKLLDSGSLSSA